MSNKELGFVYIMTIYNGKKLVEMRKKLRIIEMHEDN